MMMLEVSWRRGEIERRYNNDHFDRRMAIFFSWDTVIAVIVEILGEIISAVGGIGSGIALRREGEGG
jgi:hypothetical protein